MKKEEIISRYARRWPGAIISTVFHYSERSSFVWPENLMLDRPVMGVIILETRFLGLPIIRRMKCLDYPATIVWVFGIPVLVRRPLKSHYFPTTIQGTDPTEQV